MHIEEHVHDDGVVWVVCGRLTEQAGEALARAWDHALQFGCRRIVIDLGGVSMIDAGGLGSLVTLYGACAAHLIALCLARVPGRVRRLLSLTQLTRFLPIVDSVQEARLPSCGGGIPRTGKPPPQLAAC